METLEDKQKELDALQAEFDEYIVSSREMEEELEGEMNKCHEDLTKAESRNSALSSQLANLQPQLNSLESKVSALTSQLSSETKGRISAETRTEQAEKKLRETEGTLAAVRSTEVKKLKEENEELCEQRAFVEGEAEECRNELNDVREKHREEMEELRGDLNVMESRLKDRDDELYLMRNDQDNNPADDEEQDGTDSTDHEEGPNGGWFLRLYNDEINTAEYVSVCLLQVLGMSESRAYLIMQEAHHNGTSKLGEYNQEVAGCYENQLKERSIVCDVIKAIKHESFDGDVPSKSLLTEPDMNNNGQDQHIKSLEGDLEEVTNRLIDATSKLSQTEADLEKALGESDRCNNTVENGLNNSSSENGINGAVPATSNDTTPRDEAADTNNQHLAKITKLEASMTLLQAENAELRKELETASDSKCCIIS